MVRLTVNNQVHEIDADPETPLLYVLRGELGLNGAKFGCGLAQCGACTVMADGEAIFSCVTPVSAIGNRKIKTVEGLGTEDQPSVLQRAFMELNAAQCGYCIAGMIMRAEALLEKNPQPSGEELRTHMAPNLCRCGTHMRILAAVRRAALDMQRAGEPAKPGEGQ
jgi:aerobic-type carbon monoxide dehydrogenase small subunit (CoxS/CutS family)